MPSTRTLYPELRSEIQEALVNRNEGGLESVVGLIDDDTIAQAFALTVDALLPELRRIRGNIDSIAADLA